MSDRNIPSKNEVALVSLLRLQSPFSDGLCHKAADEIERQNKWLRKIAGAGPWGEAQAWAQLALDGRECL